MGRIGAYHRHFDDGDEFGDGLVPQEHARHFRKGVAGRESQDTFANATMGMATWNASLGRTGRLAVDEVGRAGQRNQAHYHRHYYDGDQLHMRWETATPEKGSDRWSTAATRRPFLDRAGGGRRGVSGG